jgi:pyruvate,water dikinase
MTSKLMPLEFAKRAAEVGGKAANLEHLIKNGFPVPPGFVFTGNIASNSNISNKLNNLFLTLKPPLIVRSSATIEDAVATSFAGRHQSSPKKVRAKCIIAAQICVWREAAPCI